MGVTEDKWPSSKMVVEFIGRREESNFQVRIVYRDGKGAMINGIGITL